MYQMVAITLHIHVREEVCQPCKHFVLVYAHYAQTKSIFSQ
jgi:hypothetical protein